MKMNSQQVEYIKTFLTKCNIVISHFDDLNGMLIPREIFLNKELYNSVKDEISILKQVFTSSALTSLQSTAEETQKWPLLNLVRQVLRSCHYKMTPKRTSAGYTKDGKKIYKRMFVVEKLNQTESYLTGESDVLSNDEFSETSDTTPFGVLLTNLDSSLSSTSTTSTTSSTLDIPLSTLDSTLLSS